MATKKKAQKTPDTAGKLPRIDVLVEFGDKDMNDALTLVIRFPGRTHRMRMYGHEALELAGNLKKAAEVIMDIEEGSA